MAEFPPKFDDLKGLAEELCRALFTIRDELFFTGIYRDPDKLYKPMIDAFERTIAKYRWRARIRKSILKGRHSLLVLYIHTLLMLAMC